MLAPRNLAAAFLSAAMLLTSSVALADKGGNGHANGNGKGAPNSASSQPGQAGGQSANHGGGNAGGAHAAGASAGPGGTDTTTTRSDRNSIMQGGDTDSSTQFQGGVTGLDEKNAKIHLKMRDGSDRDFDVDTAVLNDLKTRKDTKNLLFFSADGRRITAVAQIGETDRARVMGMNNGALTIQTANGETRVITLDAKSIARLKLHTGSDVDVTAGGPQGGRIVAVDMLKKHAADKFANKFARNTAHNSNSIHGASAAAKHKARKSDADIDNRVADNDAAKAAACGKRSGSSHGRAFANQMAKDASNDASGHNPPGLPHECVNPAGHTRGFCKSGSSQSDCSSGSAVASDNESNTNRDTTANNGPAKCGKGAASNGRSRAFDNQMAKDAANDASGHNPPGLPHECVNPAGHTRGFCKGGESSDCSSGSSLASTADVETSHNNAPQNCERGSTHASGHGRAFANQMAKDASNDASGHNPPGLPHECVNPAGHTRGWCKDHSEATSATCASATLATTGSASALTTSSAAAPAAAGSGNAAPLRPSALGARTPALAPVPAGNAMAGNQIASIARGTSGSSTAPAGLAATGPVASTGVPVHHPTRVMGAAVGPSQIHLVRPLANTPCVWRKTTVAAATYHRSRRVGTSYTAGHHPLHHTVCH